MEAFSEMYAWADRSEASTRAYEVSSGSRYFSILILWLMLTLFFRPKKRDFIKLKLHRREKEKLRRQMKQRRVQEAAEEMAAAKLAGEMFLKLQQMRIDVHPWEIKKVCTPAFWPKIESREKKREHAGLRYLFDPSSEPKIRILHMYKKKHQSFSAKITGRAVEAYAPPNSENRRVKPVKYQYYLWIFHKDRPPRIHFFSTSRYWVSF
ncbi:MAG: hypothetical protein HN368_13760 [Spirochaetales bacterium]|nr:hypothetical protein [Spirochaetales bacterium]